MTDQDITDVLSRYLAGELTAERAADLIGPGTSVAEVVLETCRRFGRLPDRNDAFAQNELRRGLELLAPKPRTAG